MRCDYALITSPDVCKPYTKTQNTNRSILYILSTEVSSKSALYDAKEVADWIVRL